MGTRTVGTTSRKTGGIFVPIFKEVRNIKSKTYEEFVEKFKPELTKLVNDTVEKLKQEKTRKLSKYDYPDHIVTAAMMQKMAHYGVHFRVRREECQACAKPGRPKSHEKRDLRGRASAVRPGGSQEAERRKAGSRKCQKAGGGYHLL